MHLAPVCRGLFVLTASVAWRLNGDKKIKRLLKKTLCISREFSMPKSKRKACGYYPLGS